MVDSNDRERVGEAREELMRMLGEDELRDATLLVLANKQVSYKNHNKCACAEKCGKVISINRNVIGMVVQEEYLLIKFVVAPLHHKLIYSSN